MFTSCSKTSPEKYFDIAVLNTNMLNGFASTGMMRELESPSVKMSENNGETVPMKRSEVLNAKIEYIESSFENLKDLKKTDDTKDLIEASLALYEYVLPVYKTEYIQLANLYDSNSPAEQIQSLSNLIKDKYSSGYVERFNKLIGLGKLYAEKNNIKVNWGVY